ncbi:DEAD/DEAH box helicase, partial [Streptomyces kronopolitis]
MNRTARTNDRYSRSAGSSGSGRGYRSGGPNRSGTGRSGGPGRRPATQGEFALPVTHTPALPPAETFTELDMPSALRA